MDHECCYHVDSLIWLKFHVYKYFGMEFMLFTLNQKWPMIELNTHLHIYWFNVEIVTTLLTSILNYTINCYYSIIWYKSDIAISAVWRHKGFFLSSPVPLCFSGRSPIASLEILFSVLDSHWHCAIPKSNCRYSHIICIAFQSQIFILWIKWSDVGFNCIFGKWYVL